MTTQAQTFEINTADVIAALPRTRQSGAEIDEEQRYRASAYSLLAALLRQSPDTELLDYVNQLAPVSIDDDDPLLTAMSRLALSAKSQKISSLEDEYQELFIGLGKGEVVPYGSWYLTGFLMEQPLSDLRDHLKRLGFERNSEIHEPEDHVAALCEVMAVMIADATSLDQQKVFYAQHMQPWFKRFFEDLENAGSANFYESVAQFGAAFIDLDQTYMSMQT